MTNDSKLFRSRAECEKDGYQPDEYSHWLKGLWKTYTASSNILDRPSNIVLSRDGSMYLTITGIEYDDVALPLYEGRMINQFDFSEKGWVSGKGRKAIWDPISFKNKIIQPQYLMALSKYYGSGTKNSKLIPGLKVGFLAIGSATNSRSMFAGLVAGFPAGNSVAVLQCSTMQRTVTLMAILNSFVYDFSLRNRLGGLNLNYFVIEETPIPLLDEKGLQLLTNLGFRLGLPHPTFADYWLRLAGNNKNWLKQFALTRHERARLKAINEAVCTWYFGLGWDELKDILEDTDLPRSQLSGEITKRLNPKGFWRVDQDVDPEIRHSVLSLIAFHDLQRLGLQDFLSQNGGEGWLIPEKIRLADYGLGHDERAKIPQPVASRLGPRFYDWQLDEEVDRSWKECAAHAELIRRIVPMPDSIDDEDGATGNVSEESGNYHNQEGFF